MGQPAGRDPGERPLRADAARNRAAIVRAASRAFAERGRQVDVREIARCAGVGMGTLYRHFPTKDDLLATVLDEDFDAWTRSARADAAAQPDPWQALCAFMTDALARQARQRATLEHLAEAWRTPALDRCRRELHPVLEDIVASCHRAGVVRPGVGPEDISLLLIGLGRIVEITAQSQPDLWRRQLRVTLDGLRARHEEPLPDDARSPPGMAGGTRRPVSSPCRRIVDFT